MCCAAELVFAGVSAVLFDLDGTFIDSAPDMSAAINHMRVQRHLPALPLSALRHAANSGARGLIGAAFGLTPTDADFSALRDEFYARYDAALVVHTAWMPGIADLVAELEKCGIDWGIVTNKSSRFALPIAKALHIVPRAACLVCGDTTPHTKPHPAPLLHAARMLGRSAAACVYVGDDPRDVKAANAAGMLSIAAQWGYLAPDDSAADWGATAVFTAARDLIGLFAPSSFT